MKTGKFGKLDNEFIEKRDRFFQEFNDITAKFAVDNWPLLAGHVPISVLLARYEVFKTTADVPGHVLEFGVFNGANLLFMAKLLDLLNPHSMKCIFGFDTFMGLTEFSDEDSIAREKAGHYVGNVQLLEEMIEMHGLTDRCQLVKGPIESTLPEFLLNNKHHIYSFIYFDTDLYESTKIGLKYCWPRLSVGGKMVFDEGYDDTFPGEGVALQEFLQKIPGQYLMGAVPFARQPMIWVEKK